VDDELQIMDETLNQLAGGWVPVVALIQTLAEFATSYGNHISHFTDLGRTQVIAEFCLGDP
jgi:hypothetical protein